MPTVPEGYPRKHAADVSVLDPSSCEGATRLIFRIKNNNRALETLVRALDGIETRPDAGSVDGATHA